MLHVKDNVGKEYRAADREEDESREMQDAGVDTGPEEVEIVNVQTGLGHASMGEGHGGVAEDGGESGGWVEPSGREEDKGGTPEGKP